MLTSGKTFQEWFYDRPVSPQLYGYLVDANGRIPEYLHLIDFESYARSCFSFLENCGLNISEMPWEKKTNRRKWHDYYDEPMIECLRAECPSDFALIDSL